MSDFENDNEMPEPMKKMLRGLRKAEEFDTAIENLMEEQSSKIESEVLLGVWQEIGDSTETYWEALCASRDLVDSIRKIRKIVKGNGNKTKRMILRSIVKIIEHDIRVLEMIEAVEMKVQHGEDPKSHKG